ncbi:terminase, partial [Veillonellaceae bacterium M2-8]|nr:terminase [Veillonellaceae bacterium M2-8]
SGLVASVRATNGQQAIEFTNGSRILFGARESGFGRGFAMVDVIVFDEAQILTENALSDMVPATNAAPNGLVLMMGTPPRPKDPG